LWSLVADPGVVFIGSLSSHQSSYYGQYSFGQTLVTPEDSSTRESNYNNSNNHAEEEEDNSHDIKPANENEVGAWSATGSSDILF